jgi:hypothetical protein
MDVKNIISGANAQYDSFLVDALNINKNKDVTKNLQVKSKPLNSNEKAIWQQNVLLNAIDKLENNIQVDKTNVLFSDENAPLESYQEALAELRKLVVENNQEYMRDAQANLTPKDILYLFEDQFEFFV